MATTVQLAPGLGFQEGAGLQWRATNTRCARIARPNPLDMRRLWYRRSVPNRWATRAHPRAGWVGGRVFPGFTANPQHTFGPSWSVRRMPAPRSVGPAVFLGSPPTDYPHKLPQYSAKGITTQILGAKCQHKPIYTRSEHSQTRATKNASETRAIPQKKQQIAYESHQPTQQHDYSNNSTTPRWSATVPKAKHDQTSLIKQRAAPGTHRPRR